MSMEGLSPQNRFGVSGVNSLAAKSNTIEVAGDRFFKILNKQQKNNRKCLHTNPVMWS